ncbi:ATP-binding protein [Clostridium sp. AF37-5AT]|nr:MULTISPECIES: AAA family ATPase [unclassified Clostridium]RHN97835.1 ATP-binding protein [Clostridium sp. AM22-16AC]RHO91767.1 ATP-binding protein [Clostridium sp. AF37-5AT]RHS60684.1 ATP-binding protein [Clostridium sp. AM45-5]
MIFKRKIYDKLLEWKNLSVGGSAAFLEGARRIGKSTIVEEFAKNEYDDYMILDFAREGKDIRENFIENMDHLDVFFRNLFLLKGKDLTGERCVIIFDEVQMFPQARQAIKYLVADGRYDYIETGSLISIRKNVQDILIPSEEYRIKMFPMDFEEYLWAIGDHTTIPVIKEAFNSRTPLGDAIHRKIMKNFRTYMAVGGMPQAVEALVQGKTFAQIDFIKRNILTLYEEDLAKYDKANQDRASVIYKTIPEQLENKNSHFKFSLVDKSARYQMYVDAVKFITDSMIGNECINVTVPEIVPELYADRSNFKLYMGDTGLLVSQIMKNQDETDENLYKSLIFDKLGINQGMILENVVAQMLRASGHALYFHEYYYQAENTVKEKKYEIDFLIVKKKKICPIEVKSSNYSAHKSFDYLTKKYPIKLEDRYIIYTKDLKFEDQILYLPVYMTMLI